MWTLSAAAQAALTTSHKVATLAEVTDPNGAHLQYLDVLDGEVPEDETAAVRRQCRVTLATTSLVPGQVGDLLHPLSGNELRLYRGVTLPGVAASTLPGGTLAPLGVFRCSKPDITDTGDQVVITLTGLDRSSEISRQSWTGPYNAVAGQTIGSAIQTIINSRWHGPALTFNFAPSSLLVPTGYTFGLQFTSSGPQAATGSTSGGNDPWADCVQLARTAGCELFFDRTGALVMRAVPQPNSQPVQFTFIEGPACTMTQVQRSFDESKFRNGVILIGVGARTTNSDGSSSPAAPVVASVYSADPQLGPSGPLGARPEFISDQIVATLGDATNAATAWLPMVMNTLDQPTITATVNPAIDAGDSVGVIRARMNLDGVYIPSAVNTPLGPKSLQTLSCRGFQVIVPQNWSG